MKIIVTALMLCFVASVVDASDTRLPMEAVVKRHMNEVRPLCAKMHGHWQELCTEYVNDYPRIYRQWGGDPYDYVKHWEKVASDQIRYRKLKRECVSDGNIWQDYERERLGRLGRQGICKTPREVHWERERKAYRASPKGRMEAAWKGFTRFISDVWDEVIDWKVTDLFGTKTIPDAVWVVLVVLGGCFVVHYHKRRTRNRSPLSSSAFRLKKRADRQSESESPASDEGTKRRRSWIS